MTELDLGLKVAARRLLWRMGYTTRVDVALRSIGSSDPRNKQRKIAQAFTDVDVLGLAIGPGFKVHSAMVDCKTSTRGSTERMFWVRGVADFFGADTAYLVREHELSHAARQLAARLNITALTSADITTLEEFHPTAIPVDRDPIRSLFDRERVAEAISAYGNLERSLKSLAEYRSFDYWIYDKHRNLVQLVEHLRGAGPGLDSRNPLHLAMFFDLCWLYLLTITHAVDHIRSTQLARPQIALQEYLLGGPLGLREKEQLSKLLGSLRDSGAVPAQVDVTPLPSYFSMLLELVARVLRRPENVMPALHQLEVLTAAALFDRSTTASAAFGNSYNELAAKQAADVAGFLVRSADLDPGFRDRGRLMLLNEIPVAHDGTGGPAPANDAQQTLLPRSDESVASNKSP